MDPFLDQFSDIFWDPFWSDLLAYATPAALLGHRLLAVGCSGCWLLPNECWFFLSRTPRIAELGHLELFEAVLGHGGAHLGTHFGATWAILGYLRPSWAILELEDAKMR